MPRVLAHSPTIYDEVDYSHRSSSRPHLVSAWEVDTGPQTQHVLVSLWTEDGGRQEPVCLFLTLSAAHQIGKALRSAVKDCLDGEDTEGTP